MNDARSALVAGDSSTRLQAAMAAGTTPDESLLPLLVERCAVEPDFYVREMLTWAIIQFPVGITVPVLHSQLESPVTQARSQALHTLSKSGVLEAWPWVFPKLLTDPEDEVARAAWRVAVAIVPRGLEDQLTSILVGQFGRGDTEVKTSLARALAELSILHDSVLDEVEAAAHSEDHDISVQARATSVILRDPGASFVGALQEAARQSRG